MKKILDLGCGYAKRHRPIKAGTGTEIVKLDIKEGYADVVHDMNEYPYPFEDNSFDEVHINHSEYYVADKEKLMAEIHRISRPGARVIIRSIHFSSLPLIGRETRYAFFTTIGSFGSFEKFEVKKVRLHYFVWESKLWKRILSAPLDAIANISPRFTERVWCYLVGGFEEIQRELEVVK